jgi:Tfp pilus assembly protein PilW
MLTRLRRDDAGMTLAELMVGMGLLLIVSTLATMFFVSQNTQTSRTLNASFTTSTGRTALARIATELRLADTPTAEPGYSAGRFQTATPTHVTFFSNVMVNRSGTQSRTPPVKIDIQVSGTKLIEQDYRPLHSYTTYPANYDTNYASNYPTTPSTVSVLVSNLPTNSSVFSFCGQPTSSTACPAVADSRTGVVASANLGLIASVSIAFTVPDTAGGNSQTVQTTVAITGAFS